VIERRGEYARAELARDREAVDRAGQELDPVLHFHLRLDRSPPAGALIDPPRTQSLAGRSAVAQHSLTCSRISATPRWNRSGILPEKGRANLWDLN
jgi:hypothetical protein